MSYIHPADSGRRLTGLTVVVLLHVLMIYALVNGLGRKIMQVIAQPLETKIIEETKAPPPDKPPPPPPKLAPPPPPFIPLPEVQVQVPQMAQTNAITAVTSVRPLAPPPPVAARAAAPVRSLAAVVNASACEKPDYPPASLRAQESGLVTLAFLIDVDGKVLDSKVEHSTGYRRLDEAARKALGLCKFKPATVDGKPEKSWAKIEYDWRIE